MKRIKVFMMILGVLLLTGCGGRPLDTDNKNIPVNKELVVSEGYDFYYNIGYNMTAYLNIDSKSYTDIVYAASSVARSTWYDGDNKFYVVSDKVYEHDINFLTSSIHDVSQYASEYHKALQLSLHEINTEKTSIIVTDLQTDLYDYSAVSAALVDKVLSKGLSVGFIGVQLDLNESEAGTFFIIVIGNTDSLSKYIDNFKENPTIINYSGEQTDFQMDNVKMINYQIIANNSGILGIDYENVEFIENGFYAGPDGNIDRQEAKGSFTTLNRDYTPELMQRVVEGTVNFSPEVQRFVNTKSNKKENKPIYLGAKSLVYETKNSETNEPISGKIKLNVPFKVISGVKLSKIQCEIDTKMYESRGSNFKVCEESDIVVTLADAAGPEQGIWRVDDRTNSVVLNILVPNAGQLPVTKGALKLDITFNQNDTIESVSNWVKNWEERGCKNIMNLFNALYTYQKDANVAENTLTVYLAPGEERITNRLNSKSELN